MFNPDEEKYLSSCNDGPTDCSKVIWVTNDHRRMFIHEMEDSHLINAILLVQRSWPWRAKAYHCLIDEAKKRGLI